MFLSHSNSIYCYYIYIEREREPVVREVSKRARYGGSDGLTVDFVVRGVWEPDKDCLFDTRIILAGSPGRATRHISCQNALNTSANEKVKKYKTAAEERHATFCPLVVTVEGIAHQSMQAFLGRIAARFSAKWQKPLTTVTNWVPWWWPRPRRLRWQPAAHG